MYWNYTVVLNSCEYHRAYNIYVPKGGLKSEDTGEFLHCKDRYSRLLPWIENLNNSFTVLGSKFKFSAQDSDLKYLSWQCKNPPASSDLKPPLAYN